MIVSPLLCTTKLFILQSQITLLLITFHYRHDAQDRLEYTLHIILITADLSNLARIKCDRALALGHRKRLIEYTNYMKIANMLYICSKTNVDLCHCSFNAPRLNHVAYLLYICLQLALPTAPYIRFK